MHIALYLSYTQKNYFIWFIKCDEIFHFYRGDTKKISACIIEISELGLAAPTADS